MTHTTITSKDVNQFEWFDTRAEALNRAKTLEKQGIPTYIGGKRARKKFNYLDIKIAAIYHNKWSGSNKPWVVAWNNKDMLILDF